MSQDAPGLGDAEIARAVERVLSRPKFRSEPESLWDRLLERLARWLSSHLDDLVGLIGGPEVAALMALLALVGLTALGVSKLARRRADRMTAELTLARLVALDLDPAELERIAREAERDGDHGRALRALFLAGLARLDREDRIHLSPSVTTGQIRAVLSSPHFDILSADFDRVAYGAHPAGPEDVARARDLWNQLLAAQVSR